MTDAKTAVSSTTTTATTATPRNAIVTGGTAGIGFQTAIKLGEKGYVVTISARDDDKGKEAVTQIKKAVPEGKVDYLVLDLDSLASVKTFAKAYLDRNVPLHLLVNNAGAMFASFALTKDGVERSWQVNHLSHFLLTSLLWPRLKAAGAAGGARVVNVSSEAHAASSQPFTIESVTKPDSSYSAIPIYGRSKLANILFTRGLESRAKGKGITFYSLHPGRVATPGVEKVKAVIAAAGIDISGAISEADGAKTSIYVATAPNIENLSGGYFDESKPAALSEWAQSKAEEDKVWAASLQLAGLSADKAFA